MCQNIASLLFWEAAAAQRHTAFAHPKASSRNNGMSELTCPMPQWCAADCFFSHLTVNISCVHAEDIAPMCPLAPH